MSGGYIIIEQPKSLSMKLDHNRTWRHPVTGFLASSRTLSPPFFFPLDLVIRDSSIVSEAIGVKIITKWNFPTYRFLYTRNRDVH